MDEKYSMDRMNYMGEQQSYYTPNMSTNPFDTSANRMSYGATPIFTRDNTQLMSPATDRTMIE